MYIYEFRQKYDGESAQSNSDQIVYVVWYRHVQNWHNRKETIKDINEMSAINVENAMHLTTGKATAATAGLLLFLEYSGV